MEPAAYYEGAGHGCSFSCVLQPASTRDHRIEITEGEPINVLWRHTEVRSAQAVDKV